MNYNRDIPGQYVLISNKFWYFGQDAILLPEEFLYLTDIARGYRITEDDLQIESYMEWLASLPQSGYIGHPYMFRKEFKRYTGKH